MLNFITRCIRNIFDFNQRELNRISKIVKEVSSFEKQLTTVPTNEFPKYTDKFKLRLKEGETLDDILPEAFAVVREVAKRTVKMRPFDVQVIGGVVLHEGNIAEMATGEGKTLVATMPAYLNALTGKGVHIVTVNDYLAKRDREWMGPIYETLGLTVGVIQHFMNYEERRQAYNCDITYGTNNEFGFDYLRDNMVIYKEQMVQRGFNYAIVDEVDSILIDEARTPLIISGQSEKPTKLYTTVNYVIRELVKYPDMYTVDEKAHSAMLTEKGIDFVEKRLNIKNLYDYENTQIAHHVEQALRAYTLYKKDRDYIVKNGQVIIVDEFTGRLMWGRRYSEGLHQAIEAKENVKIEQESQTLASITFQNYFRLYNKLAGMTGTAKTEEQEFIKIYNLNVIVIPPNKPLRRKQYPDVIYKNEKEKFKAIVKEIEDCYKRGQPVLVGTVSIEKNELLSELLKRKNIPHHVLNAKHHEKEAEIIAKAGQKGMVTIATNMAGRGTDIILGEGVAELGGLHVIGTERHESRRIDNQLRGRAGRQGDPGSSRFYISLEDDLMRIFGSDKIKGILEKLGMPDDQPIEHNLITKSIENAQKKVENHHFDMRKHVLEYDDVLNKQREVIYKERRKILEGENMRELIFDFMQKVVEEIVNNYASEHINKEEWNIDGLYKEYQWYVLQPSFSKEELKGLDSNKIKQKLHQDMSSIYEWKEKNLSEEIIREMERVILLTNIDQKWIDHLDAMDNLREGIGLRAYGQIDPLVAYKKEAFEMFNSMMQDIRRNVVRDVFIAQIVKSRQSLYRITSTSAEEGTTQKTIKKNQQKPKRNEPCPCGSGKKYKKCCGLEDKTFP